LGVRAWQLTFHSLWLDEVFSLFWANKPAATIVRVGLTLTEDKHPPLYYLLLHGWTRLFGASDAAVRSLGVGLGALAVWPTWGLGMALNRRADRTRRSAWLAAALVAFNPFLIWYSQEARMFMPATTFGLWGLYAWLRALAPPAAPGRKQTTLFWYALAVGGLAAACYSYLFAAFLLPVAGLWFLVEKYPARPSQDRRTLLRSAWPGALALLLLAALFAPLALTAWRVSGAEAAPGVPFANLFATLARLLQAYTVRQAPWPPLLLTAVVIGAGTLLLIGLTAALRHDIRRGLLLLLWLAVPLLLGNLLQAKDATVFAETRYFIFLIPALCLAWAVGLDAIWRVRPWLGRALTVGLMAVFVAALPALWSYDPAFRREDWRTAAQVVGRYATAQDVVVNHVNYTELAFARYYQGAAPRHAPFGAALADERAVEAGLDALTGADTLWLVLSHQEGIDPANLVRAWLGGRFPLVTELYPAGIAIRAYATQYRLTALPAAATPVDGPGQANGAIRLAGCRLEPGPVAATDDAMHPPSGWAHVTLYWQALATPTGDRLARVRLVDADGQVWGESLERADSALHFYPMTRWQPGEIVRDDYDVNLNPRTPPGAYRVVVTLLDEAGPDVICGAVSVTNQ
jgi:uncharacterized membrane protein